MSESLNRKEEINRENKTGLQPVDAAVFPSQERSVFFRNTDRGCDEYFIHEMIGYDKTSDQPVYGQSRQQIKFVHGRGDGTMNYGLQSEQVVIMLIDRTKKLDKQIPSRHNAKMLQGLEMFLEACKERFDERMKAGVAGKSVPLPDAKPTHEIL